MIGLLSHVLKMPAFSTELVLLIGLGVGVDYALFIVTRHRQGLIAGNDVESSIVNAVNTSGRAVLFAGIIVCIALLGMFALGVSFLYGLAIAAAIGVLFTMIAALTLLPAFLGFIGPRVLSRRQKRDLAANGPEVVGAGTKGFWPRWAAFIQRRPVLPAVVALVVVVLVALPFFSLRLGSSDQGNDPTGTTTRTAYDLLANGFGPGFNGPLLLVAENAGPGRPADARAGWPPRWRPSPTWPRSRRSGLPPDQGRPDGLADHRLPDIVPAGVRHHRPHRPPAAGDHPRRRRRHRGERLRGREHGHLRRLRPGAVLQAAALHRAGGGALVPAAGHGVPQPGHPAHRGGHEPALHRGRLRDPGGRVPVGLAGLGLPGQPARARSRRSCRSCCSPSCSGCPWTTRCSSITRIHEEYLKSGDNRTAVRKGLAATGKTITAAALIMILVFGSFILGGERVIKEFGLGLAAGILIDALLIRMAIVPSLMFLFGKANWWFPGWLDRILPRLSVDPDLQPADHPGGPAEPVEPEPVPV